jgi:hypothetical protein
MSTPFICFKIPKKTAGPSFRFAGGWIDSNPQASGEPSVKKVIKKAGPAANGGAAKNGWQAD